MSIKSIAALNRLPESERLTYLRLLIPSTLVTRFNLNLETFTDVEGRTLYKWVGNESSDVEISLWHQHAAPDPFAYFHLTDTISGQIHVLLSVFNDPLAPRFDVDKMPDESPTKFGSVQRNRVAEEAAAAAGLAPGQVRRGLRVLGEAIVAFESFIARLGHEIYFVEPLYYHNAVIFERYGFAYQQGRRWMQSLDTRFTNDDALLKKLAGSNIFRQSAAARSIRGRSWAIHDGILGEPYTGVTMYKKLGHSAGITTFTGEGW